MQKIPQEGKKLVEMFLRGILGGDTSFDGDEGEVFREISRLVEMENPIRDGWGNWDFPYCESNLRGQLYEPWLDKKILNGHQPSSSWPENKSFALCLSHDVDDVTVLTPQKAFRLLMHNLKCMEQGSLKGKIKTALEGSITFGMTSYGEYYSALRRFVGFLVKGKRKKPETRMKIEEWIKLEDQYGFHSSFFFLPTELIQPHVYDPVYHYSDKVGFEGQVFSVREIMQKIDKYGWEVGLHGSYHSATEPGLLKKQKQQIDEALGKETISTRQHWLHYDVNITPVLQAEAGFKADSTQGFNRSIGFRAGTAFPYYCWDHEHSRILPVLEIPQHIMDGSLFTTNALEYNEELAIRHCLKIMDEVEAVGGCLTLNWHPNYWDLPHYRNVYATLLQEAHRRNAWGCSVGELYNWWHEKIFNPSGSLSTKTKILN